MTRYRIREDIQNGVSRYTVEYHHNKDNINYWLEDEAAKDLTSIGVCHAWIEYRMYKDGNKNITTLYHGYEPKEANTQGS